MRDSLIQQIQSEPIRAVAGEPWPTEVLLFTQMPVTEALAMQEAMAARLARGDAEHHQLLMMEHPATVASEGAGGALPPLAFTPGQLVTYLTLDLRAWGSDLAALAKVLEKIIGQTLADFGMEGLQTMPSNDVGNSSIRIEGREIATFQLRERDGIARARITIYTNVDYENDYDYEHEHEHEKDRLSRNAAMRVSMTDLGFDVARQDEVREAVLRHAESILGSRFVLAQRDTTAKPPWLKVKIPFGRGTERVREIIEGKQLHTVCESARCPNLGECWKQGTATFMINGDICTRSCSFCAVLTGRPLRIDPDEPRRVAEAAASMGLSYVVVTAVNRDELADGGAAQFVATIEALREKIPGVRVEVLIPDLRGVAEALDAVFAARPDVLNHNIETVPRLYPRVRPQARYERSLELIARARAAGLATKSGLMLGLGEESSEIDQALRDLAAHGCRIVTIGQYLRPSARHHPLVRYVTPAEFDAWRARGAELGFSTVESGPLVRSSYHAHQSYGRHAHGNG